MQKKEANQLDIQKQSGTANSLKTSANEKAGIKTATIPSNFGKTNGGKNENQL